MTANPLGLRFRRAHPAVLALGAITLVWVLTFSILVVKKQNGFWSVDFDMGIYDQAVWLLARGQSFITVRGLPAFGHHANFGLYLFAPASWLGAGPNFLNVTQVVVLGLGVVPIYLLGRYRRLSPWSAAALAAAFLLHPALQFFTAELFHPESGLILLIDDVATTGATLSAAAESLKKSGATRVVALTAARTPARINIRSSSESLN